ncbi:MAG TPA: 4'-phosphopantetheinyl transferase superfamily protein [Blastocatellia bacterium]|nr:4'-phosphopantetheinyl transferase superfamily protein [Blastocatellia bacterium]
MKYDLDSGQIHLWCSFFSEIANDVLLCEYRRLLTEAERQRERQFYFARDRRRYLVTRALVRTVLSGYAAVAPEQWVFAANKYGKPEIANDESLAGRLSFNITHTDGLIILGITAGWALGVDVENLRTRQVSIEVADRFFAPHEAGALNALPKDRQQQRFFEYWTLKESYIKARGMGLSIPLDKFSFQFPREDQVRISIHPDQEDQPSRWRFWQLWPAPLYLAAVCAERARVETPHLMLKNVVPLVSEQELDYGLLRASEELPTD